MRSLPTDLQILEVIYDRYHDDFVNFKEKTPQRPVKNFVPIDVQAIASELKVDREIVFGRLYYHLQEKHGLDARDRVGGARGMVPFFTKETGVHSVNFPLVTSVLADLRDVERKYKKEHLLSIVAIGISVLAIIVSAVFR